MFSTYPRPGAQTKAHSSLYSSEPLTELNKFGYNPALERRVFLKRITNSNNETKFVNIYYMLRLAEYEAAYRSDVNKIETKKFMSI